MKLLFLDIYKCVLEIGPFLLLNNMVSLLRLNNLRQVMMQNLSNDFY